MIYLDSTYIVKCYVNERGTPEVLQLVQSHPGRASCLHGRLEFWAGLHRQVREGNSSLAQAQQVWTRFRADEGQELWAFFPITTDLVIQACNIVEALPSSVFVRSADALHLTCAKEQGSRFGTCDSALAGLRRKTQFSAQGTRRLPARDS